MNAPDKALNVSWKWLFAALINVWLIVMLVSTLTFAVNGAEFGIPTISQHVLSTGLSRYSRSSLIPVSVPIVMPILEGVSLCTSLVLAVKMGLSGQQEKLRAGYWCGLGAFVLLQLLSTRI